MRFKIIAFLFLTTRLFTMPGYFEPWGKDADLRYVSGHEEKTPQLSLLGKMMEQVIFFHQRVISPVDGPRSHFKPSSSTYMLQAIRKYGFVKGYVMGCDRLLRENDEAWVYKTAIIDGKIWKTDPP